MKHVIVNRPLRRCCVLLLLGLPAAAQAQADIVRGRVTSARGEPVGSAQVGVTSTAGGVTRTGLTDRDGRYSVVIANGDGDYWVTVTAIGFAPRRVQVKRIADEAALTADVRLDPAGVTLDPVVVRAPRQRPGQDTAATDVSGTETRLRPELFTLEQLGDLALLAASIPGVQIIPGADGAPPSFSFFGLPGDQNATTLNGLPFSGNSLPRDAAFNASVSTSPYDVSRGGFSGAELALRSRPPTNLTLRANSLALDGPWTQWHDPAASAQGQAFANASLGGVITAPIRRDAAFFHLAYQGGRRWSDLRSLLDAEARGLESIGLAADSLARLRSVMAALGVPATAGRVPGSRVNEQGLAFGSLDFLRPTSPNGEALNLLFAGGFSRQRAAAIGPTSMPGHGGERADWNVATTLRHTRYVGLLLSESALGVTGRGSSGRRYLDLPSVVVRIRSELPDASTALAVTQLGGNPAADRRSGSWGVALSNDLSWLSTDGRHRLKATTQLSRESISERFAMNTLGTFRFNSLADLEAGRAASFERQLVAPGRDVDAYRGALALGDVFTPRRGLQVVYGGRLDAVRFGSVPARNEDAASRLGIATDRAPGGVYVSPRLGFSWSRGVGRQLGAVEGAARGAASVLRGGVGVFQGLPSAASLGEALSGTGLPSASRYLVCAGPAAPVPEWSAYAADVASIPTTCADGTEATPFVSARPAITYFDPSFRSPRSVRSNLQWAGAVLDGRLALRADATYSRNLDQPTWVDVNFDPTVGFTLAGEGGRPVFAAPGSIDPATGAIAPTASRRVAGFARVTALRSGLRSDAGQLTIAVSPGSYNSAFSWSVAYVLSSVRDEVGGFASTAGTPLSSDRGRSSLDARHRIHYSLGTDLLGFARLNWSGAFSSGLPYTPMAGSDINGDGVANDRAYVFDPDALAEHDPAASDVLRGLMNQGSPAARCLRQQVGRVASRGSCIAPWSSSASLTLTLNPVRWWRSNRFDVAFQLLNPLGAADLALHGANELRGWGRPASPPAELYYTRGFDRDARRYRYEVNPRFGDTRPSRSTLRAPVILTTVVRVDVGPTRERQTLIQQLDRGRRTPGPPMPEALLRAAYGSGGVFNPVAAILRNADSLGLTSLQADTITMLNQGYTRRLAQLWSPIIAALTALPPDYDRGDAYATYVAGRRQTVDLLASLAPTVLALLTPSQRRSLPPEVLSHLDHRYLATIRSGTAGLGLAFLPGASAPTGSSTGGAMVGIPR